LKSEKQILKESKLLQTVSITVSGKVQGVFFRKYTIAAALKFDITGFVKNTSEGTVYIEATGTENAIKEFINWCNEGSPWSSVEKVVVNQLVFAPMEDFVIRN